MGYFMSSGLTTRAKLFLKMLKMLKSGQNLQAKQFYDFFSKCCHSKTNTDNDMKPKLVESQDNNFHDLEEDIYEKKLPENSELPDRFSPTSDEESNIFSSDEEM